MKVKELIEKLQALDPELMVVRDGYEGGVCEVIEISFKDVALNANTAWYYGDHEILFDGDDDRQYPGKARATVAYIS
jgi:hypothetical protein